jgi:excisionase family DNA binding protein
MTPTRLAYSISEACRLLSVGRTTIYRAIKSGQLKTCKIGRRTLVTAEALQLWLGNLPSALGNFASDDNNQGGDRE